MRAAHVEREHARRRSFSARRGRAALLLGPVILLGVLVGLRLPWLHAPLVTQDEGIIVLYAQQILDGRLPQRDFYTVYGPGTFGLTAAAFALFGSSLVVERLVGLAMQALVVQGVYLLARGRGCGRPAALGASVLSVLCLTPLGLAAYAWVGGLCCIVWGLVLLHRRTHVAAAFALLAMSAVFRPEMVVPALAAGLPYLGSRSARRGAVMGLALGLAPSAVFYATWGRRVLQNAVLDRGFVNAKHPFDGRVAVILGVVLVMTLTLTYAAWRRRSAHSVSDAALVVLMLPQLLQRTDLDHFAYVAALAGPLVFITLGSQASSQSPIHRLRRLALAVAVVALVIPARLGDQLPRTTAYEVAGRTLDVEAGSASGLSALRQAVLAAAPPNGKVFIGTQNMRLPSVTPLQLYFLLPELRTSAYFLELPIGISDEVGRRIADDIRDADVLVLSRFPEDVARRLLPYVPLGPTYADDAVRAGFCRVGGPDELWIMVRCGRTSAAVSRQRP